MQITKPPCKCRENCSASDGDANTRLTLTTRILETKHVTFLLMLQNPPETADDNDIFSAIDGDANTRLTLTMNLTPKL